MKNGCIDINIILQIIQIVVTILVYKRTINKMQQQIDYNYKIKVDEKIDAIKEWLLQEESYTKDVLQKFNILTQEKTGITKYFTKFKSIKEKINGILIVDEDIDSIFKNMCGNDEERQKYFRAINNFRNTKRYAEKIGDKKSQKIIEKFMKMIDSMCEYESRVIVINENIEEYREKQNNKYSKEDLYYIGKTISNIEDSIEKKQLFVNMKNKIEEIIIEIDKQGGKINE